MDESETKQELSLPSATQLKRILPWVILAVILTAAWSLRAYHLDYPVIGYHNWKETHYLTEARQFASEGFFQHGFFVPATDYPLGPDPTGAHPDTFPLLQIITAFAFRIFGESLAIARGIVVLFSLAGILAMYFFAKQLFKREDAALLSAAVLALMPLTIFFGRNFQLDAPGLFFMILAGYFYLRWRDGRPDRDLVLSSLFLTLAVLQKYTFILIAGPALLTFPFRRLREWRAHLKPWLAAALIPITIPLWIGYTAIAVIGSYGLKEALTGETVKSAVFSDPGFWLSMRSYIADNYTWLGFWLAIIGLALAVLLFRKQFSARFISAFTLTSLGWIFIMGYKLGGHSYHQYPLVPLVVLGITFLALLFGDTLAGLTRIPIVKYVALIAVIALLWVPIRIAANRQFDTQFYGLDQAGEYIRTRAGPDDRILHSGHQSYGLHWSADRKGRGYPSTVAELQTFENDGTRWILLYQWGLANAVQNQELWDYLKTNYRPAQLAMLPRGNEPATPVYLLLEKGGNFTEASLQSLQGTQRAANYELTGGIVQLAIIDY